MKIKSTSITTTTYNLELSETQFKTLCNAIREFDNKYNTCDSEELWDSITDFLDRRDISDPDV